MKNRKTKIQVWGKEKKIIEKKRLKGKDRDNEKQH